MTPHCPLCRIEFKDWYDAAHHMDTKHTRKKDIFGIGWGCLCGQEFKICWDLRMHLSRLTEEEWNRHLVMGQTEAAFGVKTVLEEDDDSDDSCSSC